MSIVAEVYKPPKRVSFDGEMQNNHPINTPGSSSRTNLNRIGTPPRMPTPNMRPGFNASRPSLPNINTRMLYMKIVSLETELYEAEEQIERTKRSVRSLHYLLNNLIYRRPVPTNLGMKQNLPKKPAGNSQNVEPDVIVDIPMTDKKEEAIKTEDKPIKMTGKERAKKGRRRLFLTPLIILLLVFPTLLLIWTLLYSYLSYPSFFRDLSKYFKIFWYLLFFGS
ncbi:uncharacterized protein LOC123316722 [Coccinella septempunctata]|uniref:uncharacterized protein LOC123316722 n=1 Tax=Coccinella septempunctata TaxID=41139 RepID=UPI001D09466A|nr:uncharacterized protein LOC123316722 [Coccinella septempunctata]